MMDQLHSYILQATISLLVKALGKPRWLRNINIEVRIMVTSCLNVILIIFVPNDPYDDTLRMIFQLLVRNFDRLGYITYYHFPRIVSILEIFTKFIMGCILLHMYMTELVYEMFHHFILQLDNIMLVMLLKT